MPTFSPVKKYVSNTGVRIYRIPCQVFESLSARVYLLLGAGPPTLVDAGSGIEPSTRQILAGVEAMRDEFGESVRPADVGRILVSHSHVDHIGGLAELLQHTHAQVAVHPLDRGAVASHREYIAVCDSRFSDFLRRSGVDSRRHAELLKDFHHHEGQLESVPVGLTLEDGDELDGLRIIHTPGHSPGHVCIGVGNVLLSADHILALTIPHVWPESATAYTGLGHYLESLDKVRRMTGFELTLAAHEQVIHDLPGRIKTIRSAYMRRLDRLLEMLRKIRRPLCVHEIALEMYPETTGFRAVLSLADIGARVEYLHQRGQMAIANLDEVEREQNPVFRYEVV
jgi:glyoxylase-like metal-dependent hydrolase (beta-lactamase superfamily II)